MKRLFQILFFVFLIGIISAVADEYLETARLEETNDSVSSALPVIVITAENAVFELELYDNAAARRLIEQSPPKLVMTRRGDGGYYGVLREKINVAGLPTRRAYKPGEAALWIRENALYLFFGPTPASLATDTPMITSAGVGLGRLKSFSDLDQLPAVAEMSLQIKK